MPAEFQQLDHVAIHVSDVERSCRFYRDVLRLAPIPRPAFSFPGAWFRLGQKQELHLIGERKALVHSHNRGNHFALLTSLAGFDEWECELRRLGVDFVPRRVRPDGALQMYVVDPDGHFVEICTPPGVAG
jgi:catechol 2,3-dioxygenase-like lactoylglutathione lyase family enzyme